MYSLIISKLEIKICSYCENCLIYILGSFEDVRSLQFSWIMLSNG